MTKDVLVSISGKHIDIMNDPAQGFETGDDSIEVVTPANYYCKNGKHYIIYEELVEGLPGSIKNKVRISDGMLEIIKSGISNFHMVFEKDKINMTQYETPYGELLVGVYTRDMKMDIQENEMDIRILYDLDINGEKVADSEITMSVRAKQE